MSTLLDDLAPSYDFCSRHTIQIAASPALVYETARNADLGRPWLVRLLMAVRVLPALLVRRGRQGARNPPTGERSVGRLPFTSIAEVPGEEFVLGLMGRFRSPTGGIVAATAERFGAPPPAGLAQAFWNFRVEPGGRGTDLSTETRVRCGDDATRRQFGRYWRIIRPGSSLIRNSTLSYIRRMAERAAA